jgi:hypothetical protein
VTGVTVTSNTYLNANETYDYQNSAAAAAADTIQLTATVVPSEADDPSVTWSSDNTDIATVSTGGLITIESLGTYVYGAVTITATTNDNGFTDTFSMYITETEVLVTSITISGDTTVMEGLTTTLSVTIEPFYATNQTVSWESSNTDIATVDSDGVVTGVAAGTVTITATANDGSGVFDEHDIEVTATVTTIFSWSTPETFNATSAPATVDGYTVTFRSSSSPVVSTTGINFNGSVRFNIGTHCNDNGGAGGTNDPTTSTHNVTDGEFDFSAAATVTITYTDQSGGEFSIYVNNNTTSSSNSMLGSDSRIFPNEALAASGTCTFTIDPASFSQGTETLTDAFIQLRTPSENTINLTSIQISYD